MTGVFAYMLDEVFIFFNQQFPWDGLSYSLWDVLVCEVLIFVAFWGIFKIFDKLDH